MVELFSIYQKFIQYAMPSTDNLLIYSTKSHPNEPEKCIVELRQNGKIAKYVLNHKTRMFEEMKEKKKQDNQKTQGRKLPEEPDDEER